MNLPHPQTQLLAEEIRAKRTLTEMTLDDPLAADKRQRAQNKLNNVQQALQRLQQGTYGLCLHCHRPIPAERLQLLPEAPLCVTCQAQAERRHHHIYRH